MSQPHRAIVWIDHREAKVYQLTGDDEPPVQVNSHHSLQRLHHRSGGWEAGGNPQEDGEFFRRVADTLGQSADIMITGPGDAKVAFKGFIDRLHPQREAHVFTVEMINHPGDGALVARGRECFLVNTPPGVTP